MHERGGGRRWAVDARCRVEGARQGALHEVVQALHIVHGMGALRVDDGGTEGVRGGAGALHVGHAGHGLGKQHQVPQFLHFEPFLDASSLWPDVISSTKILCFVVSSR